MDTTPADQLKDQLAGNLESKYLKRTQGITRTIGCETTTKQRNGNIVTEGTIGMRYLNEKKI